MNDKKLILSIFLILFFCIGAVSASDLDELSDNSNEGYSEDDSFSIEVNSDNSNEDFSEDDSFPIEVNSISQDKVNDDLNDYDVEENEIIGKITKNSTNANNFTGNLSKSNKMVTKLSANKVNTYYKEKSSLVVHLKDSNNKPLKNKAVKIILNGKKYSKSTDNSGKLNLNLNLKPKRYEVKISFDGDEEYKSSSIKTIVNVKKAPLAIKIYNSNAYYNPDIFFKAKVINKITKNPVEGIKVLFNVYSSKTDYRNYYSVTDKNGIATLNKYLKVGKYDVYTYIKDKPHISYKNAKNKVSLKVWDTSEMGCSSIYVYKNENESAIAFRRDSTYAANLYIVVQKWHGRTAIKQYKTAHTYFFHAITTSDGWLMGTGGWDNPDVNKKVEKLAGKIVSSNSFKSSLLKSIKKQERRLNTGHFAIVAPDGRYAVIWKSGIIKGKLKKGDYLKVPNVRSLYRHGKYSKFAKSPEKAALRIAATDSFGVNRRNIMVYHYKRTTKNFKTTSSVDVYGSNDKGNLAGRHTASKKDNVYYKKKFISKNKLPGSPNKKFIGTHKFGNIDKLFKTQTKISAPKVTSNFNQSKYLKVTLKNKKTNNILKGVKVNIKVYTGNKTKSFVVKTDKNGVAKLNTKGLKVGSHKVVISTSNNKYIISGKTSIVIKKVIPPKKNNSTNSNSSNGNTSNSNSSNGNSSNNNSTESAGSTNSNDSGDSGDSGESSNDGNSDDSSICPSILGSVHPIIISFKG